MRLKFWFDVNDFLYVVCEMCALISLMYDPIFYPGSRIKETSNKPVVHRCSSITKCALRFWCIDSKHMPILRQQEVCKPQCNVCGTVKITEQVIFVYIAPPPPPHPPTHICINTLCVRCREIACLWHSSCSSGRLTCYIRRLPCPKPGKHTARRPISRLLFHS